MRYVKLILLVICLGTAALFFIQNQTLLLSTLGLKVDLYLIKFITPDVPLYAVIICSFIIGVLISLFFLLVDKIHISSQLRTCRKRLRSLEEEVNSLRNLPLQNEDSLGSVAAEPQGDDEIMGA